MSSYADLIARKVRLVEPAGFDATTTNPQLFDWQRATVDWACGLGRCALFADTGLGKTRMQLQWARQVHEETGGRILILAPLAVGAQTVREARDADIDGVEHDRTAESRAPIVVTNYERLHHFDPARFAGVVLDESSILKNYTGKTKRALVDAFASTPYRLCCTATPAPNDHLELGSHAEMLGIMETLRMLSRWFVNDSGQTNVWRLKRHAVSAFWDWVSSWARCVGVPSDIGDYPDDGYVLPELRIHRHSVGVDLVEGRGEHLFRMPEMSATSMHREKRRTAGDRARLVAELVGSEPIEPWVIWVETNYDAEAVRAVLPAAVDVRGSMPADEKERRLLQFTDDGGIMLTKPGIAGMGLNWQHCARVIFNGPSFSYERLYQAIRRCWRFGQVRPVDVHVVLAETETSIWSVLDRKSDAHEAMKAEMFAASRRAASRCASGANYYPTPLHRMPTWLQTR